ncbi:hypothetical protein ACFQZ4_38365 [Catellatospora coxensis]
MRLSGDDVLAASTGLLTLLGHAATALDASHPPVRFPGLPPMMFHMPPRDPGFTGRDDDLGLLRARLRDHDDATLLPAGARVAVQGMGGIGKTQLAVEYAHRYAGAYDLVWWIDATADVTAQLAALAPHLAVAARPTLPAPPAPRWPHSNAVACTATGSSSSTAPTTSTRSSACCPAGPGTSW